MFFSVSFPCGWDFLTANPVGGVLFLSGKPMWDVEFCFWSWTRGIETCVFVCLVGGCLRIYRSHGMGSASLVTSECSRLWRRDLAHQVHGWNKSGVAHRRAWLRAMYAAWESGILLENVLQKVFRTCSVLYILTWKCASRHSGVQFFHNATSKSGPRPSVFTILTWKCSSRHSGVQCFYISTSKSGPPMRCFVHFDLKMCFAQP